MAHANAYTLFARRLMVERVAAGWPAAHVAEQLSVSRATVHKWLRRLTTTCQVTTARKSACLAEKAVDCGRRGHGNGKYRSCDPAERRDAR